MRGRGRAYWTKLVTELARSGLTHAEFAAKRDVSVWSLRTWLYRLRREERGQPRILPVRVVGSTAPTARRQDDAAGASVIEADLPTGVRLRFSAATDPAVITDLLRRLG
jgi:hypothetical protein